MFEGKTVVLGICGGIAAYKAVEVVSRLRKLGAETHVIMTESATKFIAPLTFQSISHNLVTTDMFAKPATWDVEHISLARKADIMVIVPATANIIGKVASGIADDMLSTAIMATKAKVVFIPAMNPSMYENPIVQANIAKLKSLDYIFMEPETGLMAAEGEYGKGRLPEPVSIVEFVKDNIIPLSDLSGKKILITAGPTREAIDPVRYITNHSSGKMGYAIAKMAKQRGAEVKIISGPVNIKRPDNIEIIDVNSADEMYKFVMDNYEGYDILIMVAAVADYKCLNIADKKIKKKEDKMNLELVKNPDIARELGRVKGNRILVGFSAETNELITNAKTKLEAKNLDMVVANDVTMQGAGFGTDTNIVKLIKKDGSIKTLPMMSKDNVAAEILNEVLNLIQVKNE